MDTQADTPTLRELMPYGYSIAIAKATGGKNISTIVNVVSMENPNSKYWPAAVALAKKTNPEGYAKWEEARNSQRAYSAPADLSA
jgi:hypothetical protein